MFWITISLTNKTLFHKSNIHSLFSKRRQCVNVSAAELAKACLQVRVQTVIFKGRRFCLTRLGSGFNTVPIVRKSCVELSASRRPGREAGDVGLRRRHSGDRRRGGGRGRGGVGSVVSGCCRHSCPRAATVGEAGAGSPYQPGDGVWVNPPGVWCDGRHGTGKVTSVV